MMNTSNSYDVTLFSTAFLFINNIITSILLSESGAVWHTGLTPRVANAITRQFFPSPNHSPDLRFYARLGLPPFFHLLFQ